MVVFAMASGKRRGTPGADTGPIQVLIDTDIGEDIDDIFAIAFALRSPEFEILGITTVDGDTRARSRIARKLTAVCGKPDIPVAAGRVLCIPQPDPGVINHKSVTQFDAAPDESGLPPQSALSAEDLIADTAARHPGQVSLLTIGSMANVGHAFIRHPKETALLKQVVTNGGGFGSGRSTSIGWNLRYDPVAASIVSRGPVPWILLPENTMSGTGLRSEDVALLHSTDKPLPRLLCHATEIWAKNKPDVPKGARPHLSDLNVFAYLLGGWLKTQPGRVYVTVPPLNEVACLQIEYDDAGPHRLGSVLLEEKAHLLRELLLKRILA